MILYTHIQFYSIMRKMWAFMCLHLLQHQSLINSIKLLVSHCFMLNGLRCTIGLNGVWNYCEEEELYLLSSKTHVGLKTVSASQPSLFLVVNLVNSWMHHSVWNALFFAIALMWLHFNLMFLTVHCTGKLIFIVCCIGSYLDEFYTEGEPIHQNS